MPCAGESLSHVISFTMPGAPKSPVLHVRDLQDRQVLITSFGVCSAQKKWIQLASYWCLHHFGYRWRLLVLSGRVHEHSFFVFQVTLTWKPSTSFGDATVVGYRLLKDGKAFREDLASETLSLCLAGLEEGLRHFTFWEPTSGRVDYLIFLLPQ